MRGSLRNVVLGAVAATVIGGCGSDDGTIPQQNAENLTIRLDSIEANVNESQCSEAQDQADAFKSEVNLLPASVDDDVKQGLQEAADQLVNLTSSDCAAPETSATDDSDTTTETTETEPATTETTTQETTTEETTTEDTTTEEEPTEEPEPTEPQEDPGLAPSSGNPGQGSGGVGSDGGIGPGSSGGEG